MADWLTTQEAASTLAVSNSRIRAMISDGLLASKKQGRDLFVSTLSVRAQKADYGAISTAMRIRVFVRDGLKCRECSFEDENPSSFHAHHVVHRSNGGKNDLENLITLCCDCHKAKHAGTGETPKSTFRFEDDVRAAIDRLVVAKFGRDKTEVVSRAVLKAELSQSAGIELSNESREAVRWWVKEARASESEIVERAIAYYDEMRANGGEIRIPDAPPQGQGGREMWDAAGNVPSRPSQGRITNVSANAGFDPVEIPGVSRGLPARFPCRCVHSGCQGAAFTAEKRGVTLCPDCFRVGHRGNQRECKSCFEDTGRQHEVLKCY